MTGRGRPRKDEGKRANGEGSVYFDKTRGKWIAAITLGGVTATGRPRYKTTTHPNEAAAHKALKKIRDAQLGGDALAAPATVAKIATDYLAHLEHADTNIEHATHENRKIRIRLHLIDDARIGHYRADRLTATNIEEWLRVKVREGYVTAGGTRKKYAKATVGSFKSDLRQVLKWAIGRAEYGVTINMAQVAALPKGLPEPKPKRSLTREQTARLIEECVASPRRYAAMMLMLVTMGVRPGEAAGLWWSDIEVDEGAINIRRALKRGGGGKATEIGATKTKNSGRLRAPKMVLEALGRERVLQARLRLACPTPWPKEWDGLVFLGALGAPPRAENLRRSLRLIMVDAGLDGFEVDDITPYEMRHTAVSLTAADPDVSDRDLIDQYRWKNGRMIPTYRKKIDPIVGERSAAMFDAMAR